MSDDVLIRVEGVSKKFCRNLKRSLWYGVMDTFNDLSGRDGAQDRLRPAEFWAVNDVSFELRRGECLGLIGRNGAGKTTLLKMLNGLIKPDRGRIEMRGRVGALIALGAGFNPILTGRENVYINGAVLGLTKKEIDAKFDEIVAFAEIEEFIDSPVQSYSSGMMVRLGFAVASAVEPDVLLLDEVLAVGDARFQAKCYDRIGKVLSRAAVILVSHSPYHIQKICNETMLLRRGQAVAFGPPEKILVQYADSVQEPILNAATLLGTGVRGAEVHDVSKTVDYGGTLEMGLTLDLAEAVNCDLAYLNIADESGQRHAQVSLDGLVRRHPAGVSELRIAVGPLYLSRGQYHGSLVMWTQGGKETLVQLRDCYSFKNDGPVRLGVACYYPQSSVEVNERHSVEMAIGDR